MASMMGARSARLSLVSAAQRFLLDVLPFREPESRVALAEFVTMATRQPMSAPVVDAVLLRCLTVLNRHADDPLPSMVDSYISRGRTVADQWSRFSECVGDALKYRGVGDISVQQAIEMIEKRYHDAHLDPSTLAAMVGRRPAALSAAFKRHTSMTLREYLRRIRLDHAGKLLTMTTRSIKEVWSYVGYNYGSNFDHDFKRRYGTSPRDYRARAIHPRTSELTPDVAIAAAAQVPSHVHPIAHGRAAVLIVDHDQSTHSIISQGLRLEGYSISTATSGAEALREVDRLSPDVMLLEYHLPDMSGVDVLRLLRRTHSRLPVVGLFTVDWDVYDEADEIHSLNAIVASKLCDLDEVKALVLRLLHPVDVDDHVDADAGYAGLPVIG